MRVDHTQVQGTCSSCHNNSVAIGKPATHVATSAECSSCHRTTAWLPASVDHSTVGTNCSSCHNGTAATGKPGNHFVTSLQCGTCHRTTAWLPTMTFTHSSPNYPGTHARALQCLDCHTSNSQTVPYRFPAYAPNCAACHSSDYRSSEHKKYESPTTAFYTVSELRDCTGACHLYTNSSMTTIKERRTSEHRVGSSEF